MRLFRKPLILLLSLALAGGAFAKKDDPGKDDKPKEGEKTKDGEKKKDPDKKKKDKKKKPEPAATPAATPAPAAEKRKGPISLPLVAGHDSKGLKIPYYDGEGKLQMVF